MPHMDTLAVAALAALAALHVVDFYTRRRLRGELAAAQRAADEAAHERNALQDMLADSEGMEHVRCCACKTLVLVDFASESPTGLWWCDDCTGWYCARCGARACHDCEQCEARCVRAVRDKRACGCRHVVVASDAPDDAQG